MSQDEDSGNSLPFIDDVHTDEEIIYDRSQYCLKIIENYQNKNRNIEIKNESPPDEFACKSLSPVAPLAEDIDFSDNSFREKLTDRYREKIIAHPTVIKLVVRGWNSTISVRGLDNKSSITFKRRNDKLRQKKEIVTKPEIEKTKENIIGTQEISKEMSKKKRWKMLTRSLIAKSAKFERKGSDERYPKYVLLKNEEEEVEECSSGVFNKKNDIYPKMIVLNEQKSVHVKSMENKKQKSLEKFDFNLKKSFKNKTSPETVKIEAEEKDSKRVEIKRKQKLSDQTRTDFYCKPEIKPKPKNLETKSAQTVPVRINETGNGSQQMTFNVTRRLSSQGRVFKEIEGILKDALKLCPEVKASFDVFPPELEDVFHMERELFQSRNQNHFTLASNHFCSVSDNHHYLCHPPSSMCISADDGNDGRIKNSLKQSYTQTKESEFEISAPSESGLSQEKYLEKTEKDADPENLQLGILSSFFPSSVVIMETYQNDYIKEPDYFEDSQDKTAERTTNKNQKNKGLACNLEVPLPDLTVKTKIVPEQNFPKCSESNSVNAFADECLTLDELSQNDDERTKSEGTETTKYFCLHEVETGDNDSTTTTCTLKTDQTDDCANDDNRKNARTEKNIDRSDKNLSLTKIGYKMYDKLTQLSLKCEKEAVEKPAIEEIESSEKPKEHPRCNITFNSTEKTISIAMPENNLTLEILNSREPRIQINLANRDDGNIDEMKFVGKNELWWSSEGGTKSSELIARKIDKNDNDNDDDDHGKENQNIKLSIGDKKRIILSVENREREKVMKKGNEKLMKEANVGTEDYDLAGGDFVQTMGENFKSLSPRKGKLLKNLKEKLEFGEKGINFLSEKMNKRLDNEKLETGIFLVQQISPNLGDFKKFRQPFSTKKEVKKEKEIGSLREYYCEECLATMRIFEDENPSVKSMVDKFETIIQLKNY